MILSEQERLLANEANLLNDATGYDTSGTTWALVHDYGNVTTPADGIIAFKFDVSAGLGASGKIALYIDGKPVEVTSITAGHTLSVGGAVWLPAGTYDVQAQGQDGGGSTISILNAQVGFCQFNDCAAYALQATTQGSGGTQNLTVNNRNTPLGALNKAVFAINVSAQAPLNELVSISSIVVDGKPYSALTFDENGPAARASSAKLYVPLSVGSSHSVYASTTNANATMYLSIIACPWILPAISQQHTPVALDFSQASNVQMILATLFLEVSKTAGIGKVKAITYGVDDWYGSQSGTAIVSFAYTLDTVNVSGVYLIAGGIGGSIDAISVDVR
jgi:hypothetical protein